MQDDETRNELTDHDTAHLSMVRRERELHLVFEQQLDALVVELLDQAGGDPDEIKEACEHIDRGSEEAQELVKTLLEKLIHERIRRHIIDEEHEPLDPDGTTWRTKLAEG